jgi:hypothetical protein
MALSQGELPLAIDILIRDRLAQNSWMLPLKFPPEI